LDIVRELLADTRVDVNHADKSRMTALHYAAQYGYLNIVTALLDAGASAEAQNSEGKTALEVATADCATLIRHYVPLSIIN
jgi:ankyrin repeat protein